MAQNAPVEWTGILVNATAKPAGGEVVELTANHQSFRTTSDPSGHFAFHGLPAGSYQLAVIEHGRRISSGHPLVLPSVAGPATLSISTNGVLAVNFNTPTARGADARSGGEQLSSNAVSEIPLNKRDFSQLLLLAAGTATDTNGGANYTEQFAIDGQRGVEATFALDGADSSDPELGGATFTNFNVDAVQEIQSSSGWMPAEIGRGGAGYTNIVTRSGTDSLHGSVFEFLRNSALDA
ncbi:MAG: carboxypeptidase-like regulatory domain-containing protein, partial [Acidobacteriaceae bacterium]